MQNIADFLFLRQAPSLPPEGLAEILDQLSWALDEELVTQIADARVRWLEGDNMEKARVALLMRDSFPYNSRECLLKALELIKQRWPQLERECTAMIAAWDRDYGSK